MANAERRAEAEATLADFLSSERGFSNYEAELKARAVFQDLAKMGPSGRAYASSHWGLALLRAVVALLAAFIFFSSPVSAIGTVALLLAAWVFVEGIFSLIGGIAEKSWYLALAGAAGTLIGWLLLSRPGTAIVGLFILTAAWALARGVSEIAFALALPKGAHGRGAVATLGVISCLFGILFVAAPIVGVFTLAFWIGLYAFFFGIFELYIAFQLFRGRRYEKAVETETGEPEPSVWHRRQRTV